MEECGKCGERAVDYDEQALALVCARCGHVADDAQLTSRVEFDESGRAGGVRVGGGGGAGDGGEPRSWMWTAGAGGGRFGGGWGEGTAETKWGGGGKSAEFKRRKNKREWEERLGAVVAGLRVPEGVRGEAVEVAERVLEGRWGGGQWMGVLMAAAVYIAARNRRLPVSMAEVAHATDCQLASVWAMFKRLLAYFPMLQPEHVDPISHVWRGVHAMPSLAGEGGKQALVRDAMRLLAFAHSHSLHTGRHAAPMAAAALLLVAAARGVVLGEAQLCAAMAVPPATVRRRFSELVPALSRLARSLHLPAAAHATSQEAFQRLLPSILALLPSPARVGHRFVMPSAGDHSADVDRNADVDKNAGLDRSGDVGRRATVEDKAAEGPAPGCVLQSSFAGGERAGRGNGAAQAGAVRDEESNEGKGGGGGRERREDGAALEPREGHAVCANQLLPPAFEDSVKAHQRRAGHISRAQQRLQQTKRDRWGRAGRRGAVGAGRGGKRVRRSMRSFGEGGGGVGAKGRQEQGGGSEDAVVDWLLLQQADPSATSAGWYRSAASTVIDRHINSSGKEK
ncbi:hypothetical protein CLOP_g20711 [Closterium sp. NIES-67]|nr:hypothetical protein CLOP_g20711 [Closterium sp. NIES-67]